MPFSKKSRNSSIGLRIKTKTKKLFPLFDPASFFWCALCNVHHTWGQFRKFPYLDYSEHDTLHQIRIS